MKRFLTFIGKTILYVCIYLFVMFWVVAFSPDDVSESYAVKAVFGVAGIIILVAITNSIIKDKKAQSNNSAPAQKSNTEAELGLEKLSSTNTNEAQSTNKQPKLPSSKKCRQIADELIKKGNQMRSCFNNAESIFEATTCAKDVRENLGNAVVYEDKAGYSLLEKPSFILNGFERDYQWKLRDAIEREENYIKKEMRGPQRNNKRALCSNFYNEIQAIKNEFSEETLDFAMDAYYRVCEVAGLTPKTQGELLEGKNTVAETISVVDGMDGHDFEAFCADLLRKNGYNKVEITRGSGDQGVDILAEKDGISYAIQCKCYSSDLGNKPVQEVFAGKSIYKCQLAVVMTNRYFTTGGLEAAKATGVLLWDRRKLQEFIEAANGQ